MLVGLLGIEDRLRHHAGMVRVDTGGSWLRLALAAKAELRLVGHIGNAVLLEYLVVAFGVSTDFTRGLFHLKSWASSTGLLT